MKPVPFLARTDTGLSSFWTIAPPQEFTRLCEQQSSRMMRSPEAAKVHGASAGYAKPIGLDVVPIRGWGQK